MQGQGGEAGEAQYSLTRQDRVFEDYAKTSCNALSGMTVSHPDTSVKLPDSRDRFFTVLHRAHDNHLSATLPTPML